ncbi:class I SAM-dependent methyltransferase [Sphaerisporangium sp. B11E5]|uniref:class I SAM-dependent methyltransferase n=1 Tax=Sphaerisporangium sp. B11E5 TaxID=3153563 RepID=UPI00325F0DF9
MHRVYNSAVVAYALSAAVELGLLDALRQGDPVDLGRFADDHSLRRGVVQAIADALAAAHIVRLEGTRAARGHDFEAADLARPFFQWLVAGNGRLLSNLADFARGLDLPVLAGEDPWGRNIRAVVAASRDGARLYFDRTFQEALEGVDFSRVADLGCGSGGRLISLVRERPGISGIGVDIAGPAVALAEVDAEKEGVADRVSFVQDDVTRLRPRADFERVDLLTAFLMGHDFWPRDDAVRTLRMLRQAFPNARDFILCDECRLPDVTSLDETIFTMGFMLVHAAMDKYIPTAEEWLDVFAESGWRCVKVVRSGLPQSNLAFRLQPADQRF